MDLFLDFNFMLDCENKINYEAILQEQDKTGEIIKKQNTVYYTVYLSRNIGNSTTSLYYYQVEIAPGIYKTIKIQ